MTIVLVALSLVPLFGVLRWPGTALGPIGAVYRLVKRLETRFLRDADAIVVLTSRARTTIERWPRLSLPPVTVIPTCVDLDRFSVATRPGSIALAPVFVYAGSLGTWYMLDEMLAFVEEGVGRFPSGRFVILTRNRDEVTRALERARLARETVTVATASPEAVPGWLARAHVGLAFYKPGWARQATCPTKIGEYLATGLPVIVNGVVGDVESVIGTNRVGVVIPEFSRQAYGQALDDLEKLWADPGLSARCREVAETHFALSSGVSQYWTIYQRLT